MIFKNKSGIAPKSWPLHRDCCVLFRVVYMLTVDVVLILIFICRLHLVSMYILTGFLHGVFLMSDWFSSEFTLFWHACFIITLETSSLSYTI